MPQFPISYAYDVPYYADFAIEADDKEQAVRIAEKLLAAGVISDLLDDQADPCIENADGARVFLHEVHGPGDLEDYHVTLPDLAENLNHALPAEYEKLVGEARNEPCAATSEPITMADLISFVKMVKAGNTEYADLERIAANLVTRMETHLPAA